MKWLPVLMIVLLLVVFGSSCWCGYRAGFVGGTAHSSVGTGYSTYMDFEPVTLDMFPHQKD